ncbi:MAG: DUF4385 domain-containing protein [Flavobacterium sp.]|nr:MAG: DUF4385 domain-containing protein [Flavobacterium sp.]
MQKPIKPSYLNFDISEYAWKAGIDYRQHPEAYKIGKGEQGVLICEPYKSEIGKHWRFKTPEIASKSSAKILALFYNYLENDDFVGADMARKYLQMGFTRARRYANYKGGKKYDKDEDFKLLEKGTGSAEKAKSAAVFYEAYQTAKNCPAYQLLSKEWKSQKG